MDANLYAEQSKVILTAQRLNDVREALAGAERNRGIPFGGQGCFELHKGAIVLADEVLALRAEIEAVRGKVAKLDAHLQDGERMIHGLINADKRAGRDSEWHSGRLDIVEGVRDKMKEFGLITEARDGE